MAHIIQDILNLLATKRIKQSPKYRLEPDKDGTYSLTEFNDDVGMYLCVATRQTKESADKVIANLERSVIYYREAG